MEQQDKSSIKGTLITVYIIIGLGVALYCWLFGESSHMNFFYNLGKGLVWPAVIFPAFGKAIGTLVILVMVLAFIFKESLFELVLEMISRLKK